MLQCLYTCNFSGDVPNQDEFEATLTYHKELGRRHERIQATMGKRIKRDGQVGNKAASGNLLSHSEGNPTG